MKEFGFDVTFVIRADNEDQALEFMKDIINVAADCQGFKDAGIEDGPEELVVEEEKN